MITFDIGDSEDLISHTIFIINRAPKLLSSNCYFGVNKSGATWWAYAVCESKWCFKNIFSLKRKSTSRELVLKLCVCSHDHHKQCLKSQGCYLRINQRALEHVDGYSHHKTWQIFPSMFIIFNKINRLFRWYFNRASSAQKDIFLSLEGLLKSTIYKFSIIMTGYRKFLLWTNGKNTQKLPRLIRQFKWWIMLSPYAFALC